MTGRSAHVRVPMVGRRYEGLLDRARRHPAQQVLDPAGLVVRAARAAAAERLLADDASHEIFRDEYFGPILAIHVYDDATPDAFDRILDVVDSASGYGLTGAVFARDRAAVLQASQVLRFAAGNFYVNDKPTGAVVGQQPFGGARASGTNDKAGSIWNLLRWVSPRSIKETFVPATDHRYPHMG